MKLSHLEVEPLCGTVNHFKSTCFCADIGPDGLENLHGEQARFATAQLLDCRPPLSSEMEIFLNSVYNIVVHPYVGGMV